MALITNLSSTTPVDIINRAGFKYTIAPNGTLTINNQDLLYQNFALSQFEGLISVTGWTDPTVGSGGGGASGVLPSSLGSAVSASSLPVVVASDQTVPVAVQSGSMTLTGVTAATDTTQAFTLSSSYSSNNATGSQILNLNGAGSVVLSVDSLGSGSQLQCYGTLDSSSPIWVGPLYGVQTYVGSETNNGPPLTGIGATGIYRFNTQGFTAFQVRANVYSTANSTGVIKTNQISGVVSVDQPVSTESMRDTFNYSFLNISPVATPTDIFVIRTTGYARIGALELSGTTTATTGAYVPFQVIHGFTANTSETATAMNSSSHFDSQDGFQFGSVTAQYYTANPTTSGTRNVIYQGNLWVPSTTSPVYNPGKTIYFGGALHSKEVMIRPNEQFSVTFMGNAIPAGLSMTANVRLTMSAS